MMKKKQSILIGIIVILMLVLVTSCTAGGHTHSYIFTKYNSEVHWKECSCGEKIEETKHTFGNWTTTKEPTEGEEGSRKRVCEICMYENIESIPKVEHKHTFSNEYTYDTMGHWFPATCDHTSEKSGYEKHNFSDGICTKCKMQVFYIDDLYFDINIQTLPVIITNKKGYTFLGVYDVEGKLYFGTDGKRNESTIEVNLHLQARYEKRSYNLHYFLDDTEVFTQTLEFDSELPALPVAANKEGYNFAGWFDKDYKIQYAKSDQYNTDFGKLNETCKYDLEPEDLYFYGKYEKKKFVVNFYDMNDTIIDSQEIFYGDNVIFNKETPSKTVNNIVYEFKGWDTSLLNVKSNLDIRPIYNVSLANKNHVFDSITLNYDPKNVLGMNFGAHYELKLNQDENITLKVWNSSGVELDKILIMNSDMSIDVIGLSNDIFELNLYYKGVKLFEKNIDFDIRAGHLGNQIKVLLGKDILDDVTVEELALVEELNLASHFSNETNEINYLLGIKYLTGLKKLDISDNELDEKYIRAILPTLKELTYLNVSNNKIENLDVLNENKNLVYLDASHNLINTIEDSNSIESLRRLRKLETLDLSHNEISNLSPISNLINLQKISFAHNKINASSIDSLVSLWNLKEIDLSYNDTLSDLTKFYSLKYITDFEAVNLSGIDMNGQFMAGDSNKVATFPTSTTLKSLTLENSNLTNGDLIDILKFTNLSELNISNNVKLDCDGLTEYFNKLGAENTLENLNISQLTITELPVFHNLNHLKVLSFNQMSNLTYISNLKNPTLSNLEELSFDDCRSIEYSSNNDLDIFDHMSSLKSLSIINAIEWIDRNLYDHLKNIVVCDPKATDSINPNDLILRLFPDEEAIRFNRLSNLLKRKVVFGYNELSIKDKKCKINYEEGQYQLVISFLNDTETQAQDSYKLIIPKEYESLTIYGRREKKYNIAIEIEDRKSKQFTLNLHSFQTNGLEKTTTIKANNSDCKLIINAYGDKVIIEGADGVSAGESGCNAIEAFDLVLNDYSEGFSIFGGNGISGAKGYSSPTNKNIAYTQRTGGNGGNGGDAIVCNSIIIKSAYKISGGAAGNGGDGGDSWRDGDWGQGKENLSGGNGGNGGNGGTAIKYKTQKIVEDADIEILGGKKGTGGIHGSPDTSNWTYKGDYYENNGNDGTSGLDFCKENDEK